LISKGIGNQRGWKLDFGPRISIGKEPCSQKTRKIGLNYIFLKGRRWVGLFRENILLASNPKGTNSFELIGISLLTSDRKEIIVIIKLPICNFKLLVSLCEG